VKWAGSRDKIFSPSGRGRAFFLTSLFIELIIRPEAGQAGSMSVAFHEKAGRSEVHHRVLFATKSEDLGHPC
jgi:hypothetical protein